MVVFQRNLRPHTEDGSCKENVFIGSKFAPPALCFVKNRMRPNVLENPCHLNHLMRSLYLYLNVYASVSTCAHSFSFMHMSAH